MRIRIRSIYTKLTLGFFGLLLVEVVLMFLWSYLFVDRVTADEESLDAEAQGRLMSISLREAAATAPETPPWDNPRVLAVVDEVAGHYHAMAWLADQEGRVVYATTDQARPGVDSTEKRQLEHITLYKLPGYGWMEPDRLFAVVEADMGRWGTVSLQAQFLDTHNGAMYIRYFLLGQFLVGLVIVLIIFPFSRFFIAPIQRLEKVVLEYSNGRLESRFSQKRLDEIGELGQAFNHMADNLEAMIVGGKELVANVSHELRSPLARLRISEELLRDWGDRSGLDGHRRHLGNIREEIDHLNGLIGRILEISRLDLREAETRPQTVDLSALAEREAARFHAVQEHQDIAFRVEVAPGIRVRGNAEFLASVLANLLDNAFKYCPRQGRVVLSLDETGDKLDEDTGTGLVRLRVENTCAPLSDQHLEAMFRPFWRAGNQSQPGHGLGLAIVRKIVERHGGRVRAENIEDGLRLEVTLPASETRGGD